MLRIKKISLFKLILFSLILSMIFIKYNNLLQYNYNSDYKTINKFESNVKSSEPLTPAGIRITAVNDSSNSMVITWYTNTSASNPKVIYSTEPTLISNITIIPNIKNLGTTYVYKAYLNNLESNRTYYYKISSNASIEREILNFTTLPIRNATSLKFLVFGDSRTQKEPRREVVKKIIKNFDDIEFTIHTGDIVEDGRIQSQWDAYFDDVEVLTKKIPGYYIEGNHEQKSQNMYDNIPLPSNGLNSYYYNFSIGPISFIGLNTERNASVQTTWLEDVLKMNDLDNDILWQIAYMHQPIFNSRSTRPDRSDLIAAWCPLFEEYDLDLVFAGHNHYYERSYPMNRLKQFDDFSSYDFKNPLNPMYLITGGAGAPLYVRDTNPSYAPFYNSTYNFIIVEINVDDIKEETTLTLETWAMPNDYSGIYLIDNMTIVKKGAFVNIHSPVNNQLFGQVAPSFNMSVDNVKLKPTWFTLNTTWYRIEDRDTNFIFSGQTGTINQTAWDLQQNGTVRIKFYANDSLGKIEYNSVIIRKDIIPPNISIIKPIPDQLFGKSAPDFSLLIDEPHLNSIWYTLDDGRTNFTFIETTGTINQSVWDSQQDGIIRIRFYALDNLENINNAEIIVEKDSSAPSIVILFPKMDEIYGITAPNFSVFITDRHLDSMWYSLNNSLKNFKFTTNSSISQSEWDKIIDSKVLITFYANDSIGNIAFKSVLIEKTTAKPKNSKQINMSVIIGSIMMIFIILIIGLISLIFIKKRSTLE